MATTDYQQTLTRLNRGSVERSFTPQLDIDWACGSTDEEFLALYPAWSVFAGTGVDDRWGSEQRIAFAKYQQMNLMIFTGMLERFGLVNLNQLHALDESRAFQDALGHFIKEETYHYMLFMRAADAIAETMPGLPKLRTKPIARFMWVLLTFLSLLPFRKLRVSVTMTVFSFAETVTMIACQVSHRRIARKDSLVNRVWALHALDEARHLTFDDLVIERYGLSPRWRWLGILFSLPLCIASSFMLQGNEFWAARQLGLRVRLWQLPGLMKRTSAVFKQRVLGLMRDLRRGETAEWATS